MKTKIIHKYFYAVIVDGKKYVRSDILAPLNFHVECPHCLSIENSNNYSGIIKCEYCKEEFYAEFDKDKILNEVKKATE
jgi:hypothetical protein